jgi:hypothetical protein
MHVRPLLDWPAAEAPSPGTGGLDDVERILADGRVVVLSGAGLSTESGIPTIAAPAAACAGTRR